MDPWSCLHWNSCITITSTFHNESMQPANNVTVTNQMFYLSLGLMSGFHLAVLSTPHSSLWDDLDSSNGCKWEQNYVQARSLVILPHGVPTIKTWIRAESLLCFIHYWLLGAYAAVYFHVSFSLLRELDPPRWRAQWRLSTVPWCRTTRHASGGNQN